MSKNDKTYTNVRVENKVYQLMVEYANNKGMKFTKVVEFAIMDYLTKATKT